MYLYLNFFFLVMVMRNKGFYYFSSIGRGSFSPLFHRSFHPSWDFRLRYGFTHSSYHTKPKYPSHRYTREIPEPAPFLSEHGAQIGGVRVFPVIKITMDRQMHIVDAFVFACIVSKDPKFEPHDWQRHYTGQYTRSGISLVYLWHFPYLILRTYRHEHV